MGTRVEACLKPGEKMNLQRFFPLYLFLFALFVRLAVLAVTYQDKAYVQYFEDVGIAINLFEGRGYVLNFTMMGQAVPLRPTAAKPPVYPFLVFLVFFAFGLKNFVALFMVHALLAASTCTLVYFTLARFSHYRAVIASVAFAVYPPFVYHSVAVPESTTLTLFLISLFCYGLLNLNSTFGESRWILISVVSGLLALTEPVTLPFLFLAVCYVAYVTSAKKIPREMMIAAVIFFATLAPWILRNYLTFKEFVLIKSSFGASLKDSMYRSGMKLPKETYATLVKQVQGMDELNEDNAVKKAMLSWIRDNPIAYLRLLPKNFLHFWWEIDRYKNERSMSYVLGRKLPYILLLVFSIPSMLVALSRLGKNPEGRENIFDDLMIILIVTYTAVYTLIGSWNVRYHFPVELGMLVFAADTIRYGINKFFVSFRWTPYFRQTGS
jgi:4-amino-4-deoxy-L-arabinose transferase-like glycosyltransferase